MSSGQTLSVALGERAYDIVVGAGVLDRAGAAMLPVIRRRHAVIVTDEHLAALHLARLQASLDAADIKYRTIVLPPGEQTKDFTHYAKLCQDILALGIERATPIIAFGGGVVGDLAGFTAATLLRGLDVVQIPTTLLAQVDSSVGGKAAIDTPQGKNLVGAFHQPVLVLADIDVLDTLPRRELLAGYAEVVKYGFIRDREFFEWLDINGVALIDGDRAAREYAVLKSCASKAEVVAADERETGDGRALLNFGHSFGHALEAETGFGADLLHGEAVALGMCLAFDLSARLGLCAPDAALRAREHVAKAGLPTSLAALPGVFDAQALFAHMQKDKKVKDGKVTLILARDIGDAFVTREVAPAVLLDFLAAATGRNETVHAASQRR